MISLLLGVLGQDVKKWALTTFGKVAGKKKLTLPGIEPGSKQYWKISLLAYAKHVEPQCFILATIRQNPVREQRRGVESIQSLGSFIT